MKSSSWMFAVVLTGSLLLGSSGAQAILVDRGSGMLYDTVLNVTWLQDANYAYTSGYVTTRNITGQNAVTPDGTMTWDQARSWASTLTVGGISGWRLARNSPVDGTPAGWNVRRSADGTTDVRYNVTTPLSELAYMYYVNLGLTAPYRPDGSSRTDWGLFGNGTSGGQRTCTVAGVTVYNVSSYLHHLGTEVVDCPTCAWLFHFGDGYQGYQRKDFPYFAWAVRDGDVAAIPLPSTATLFGVGGFLIWVSARR